MEDILDKDLNNYEYYLEKDLKYFNENKLDLLVSDEYIKFLLKNEEINYIILEKNIKCISEIYLEFVFSEDISDLSIYIPYFLNFTCEINNYELDDFVMIYRCNSLANLIIMFREGMNVRKNNNTIQIPLFESNIYSDQKTNNCGLKLRQKTSIRTIFKNFSNFIFEGIKFNLCIKGRNHVCNNNATYHFPITFSWIDTILYQKYYSPQLLHISKCDCIAIYYIKKYNNEILDYPIISSISLENIYTKEQIYYDHSDLMIYNFFDIIFTIIPFELKNDNYTFVGLYVEYLNEIISEYTMYTNIIFTRQSLK